MTKINFFLKFFVWSTIPQSIWDYWDRKKWSNKMFWGTWVCAVKCTIDCAPIHIYQGSRTLFCDWGFNSCKAGEHLSICSRSIYFLQCTVGPYFFQFCPIKKNILSQNSIPASAHATLAKVQGWLLPGIKQINVKKHVTVHGYFYRHKVWKEILGWLVGATVGKDLVSIVECLNWLWCRATTNTINSRNPL